MAGLLEESRRPGGGYDFVLVCPPHTHFDWYDKQGELRLPSPADLQARNGTGIFWHARYGHPVPRPSFLAGDDDKAMPAG